MRLMDRQQEQSSWIGAELPSDPDALWQVFSENLKALGGTFASVKDLASLATRKCWIDEDALQLLAGGEWILANDIWDAEVGITTAQAAIAESGSILLAAGPGKSRLASLAPPLHVALVTRSAIVPTLYEAIDSLADRTSVLITGPSRTADIAGVIVRGVHGPRDLWVVAY